jgi:hypothetical protein
MAPGGGAGAAGGAEALIVILSAAKNPVQLGWPRPSGFFAALRMTNKEGILSCLFVSFVVNPLP